MNDFFEIKGHASSLLFSVIGYERPNTSSGDDANWLLLSVRLELPTLKADVNGSFETHDLVSLLTQLESVQKNKGKCEFSPLEEDVGLEITVGLTGAVSVIGSVKVMDNPKYRVDFEFDSDLSYIDHTLLQLRNVCQKYPVK